MVSTIEMNNKITCNFNAVSGTLIKSCVESRVTAFHKDSPFAKKIFDTVNPHYTKNDQNIPVTVLQIMLAGSEYIIEFIESGKIR